MQLVSILKTSKSKPKGVRIKFKSSLEQFESSEEFNHDFHGVQNHQNTGKYGPNPYSKDYSATQGGAYTIENKLRKDKPTYGRNPYYEQDESAEVGGGSQSEHHSGNGNSNDNENMPDFEYEFHKLPIYGPIFYPAEQGKQPQNDNNNIEARRIQESKFYAEQQRNASSYGQNRAYAQSDKKSKNDELVNLSLYDSQNYEFQANPNTEQKDQIYHNYPKRAITHNTYNAKLNTQPDDSFDYRSIGQTDLLRTENNTDQINSQNQQYYAYQQQRLQKSHKFFRKAATTNDNRTEKVTYSGMAFTVEEREDKVTRGPFGLGDRGKTENDIAEAQRREKMKRQHAENYRKQRSMGKQEQMNQRLGQSVKFFRGNPYQGYDLEPRRVRTDVIPGGYKDSYIDRQIAAEQHKHDKNGRIYNMNQMDNQYPSKNIQKSMKFFRGNTQSNQSTERGKLDDYYSPQNRGFDNSLDRSFAKYQALYGTTTGNQLPKNGHGIHQNYGDDKPDGYLPSQSQAGFGFTKKRTQQLTEYVNERNNQNDPYNEEQYDRQGTFNPNQPQHRQLDESFEKYQALYGTKHESIRGGGYASPQDAQHYNEALNHDQSGDSNGLGKSVKFFRQQTQPQRYNSEKYGPKYNTNLNRSNKFFRKLDADNTEQLHNQKIIGQQQTYISTMVPTQTIHGKNNNSFEHDKQIKTLSTTYKGQYLKGLQTGFGHETTETGSGYLGYFLKGKKYGWGRLVLASGHYFIGEFNDDKAQGKGVFFNANSGSVYVGEFFENKFNGKGREWYGRLLQTEELDSQNENFDGDSEDEFARPKGTKSKMKVKYPTDVVPPTNNQVWKSQHPDKKYASMLEVKYGLRRNKTLAENDPSFDDSFEQASKRGYDMRKKLKSESRLFGIEKLFKEYYGLNQEPDISIEIFSHRLNHNDSEELRDPNSTKHVPATMENIKIGEYRENQGSYYEGLFKENKKHGFGKFVFQNLDIYIGQFKEDLISGKGIYKYSDGRIYEGEFFENAKHGKGKYVMKSGIIYDGQFEFGKRSGKGTLLW